jgi:HK97 family phage major capsid protein
VPYDSIISRADVQALIPEQVSRDVIQGVRQQSATLSMFRRVPVARNQVRFPVLAALPMAYWVTGDTGLKQTTEVAWANKFMNIEELAAIVPIPDAVLADSDFDVWAEVRPALEEAIGEALDAAVFFGVNAPASFPVNVEDAATAAGNTVLADSTVAEGGIQNDIDLAMEAVELDGFDPTGVVAQRTVRGRLRRARNAQGDRLSGTNAELTEYLGQPIAYPMRGLWPTAAGSPIAFVGDWTEFVVGVRQDITYSVHNEGVIQRVDGSIAYNLLQQDMSALRVVFRSGWQVSNRATRDQPIEGDRYPAAVVHTAP